jgi:general secretion pathway protein D
MGKYMRQFIVFALLLVSAASLPAQEGAPPAAPPSERFVTIDFNNVDITVFIKFISELTGRNFIVDPRVKGQVTIISPGRISVEEAFKVFESVLDVHGFAAVQSGEVIKIIPSPDARSKNVDLIYQEAALSPEDKVITQLIPLKYADAQDISKLFAPLVSRNSVVLAYTPTNTLIITGVQSNIQRLLGILNRIDVPGIGLELSLISLKHADAKKVVTLLETVFRTRRTPQQKGEVDAQMQFVADERTNSLVLLASEHNTGRIKQFVELIDQQTPRGEDRIRVRYLEYAKAEELVKVLQDLPSKQGEAKAEPGKTPVVSGTVRMAADKATNSLIITAEKEDYAVIEEIIRKLDIPRSMVYIESLILEVDIDKGFEVGVRWRALGETNIQSDSGVFGGSFSGGNDAIGEESIAEPGAGGFALGVISGAIDIVTQAGTITVPNLAAVASAFQSDRDVHILSTPQVLTTDNEEARIVVGRNVPFRTKSTQISGTAETFSSFEYRDVGLTLKITPQISKDRLVRLNISQELTALTDDPENSDFRPTTLKRAIDTTVIVEDTDTVVIGGLIDETFTQRDAGVPCLGDIPNLGLLFKTRNRSSQRTNLYVFLTPRVIKNRGDAGSVYGEKRKEIEELREGRIKMYDKNFWAPEEGIPVPPNPVR